MRIDDTNIDKNYSKDLWNGRDLKIFLNTRYYGWVIIRIAMKGKKIKINLKV